MSTVTLMVIAKEPLPGRAKTRLSPPCTPGEAAALAGAALLDTLEVVSRTPAERRVLVFDGDPGRFSRPGLEVIQQRGAGLGERLAAAFEDVAQPALLIGMDTPQLTPGCCSTGSVRCQRRRSTRCSGGRSTGATGASG